MVSYGMDRGGGPLLGLESTIIEIMEKFRPWLTISQMTLL